MGVNGTKPVLVACLLLAALVLPACSGCLGGKPVTCRIVGSGSITGFSADYRERLEQLAGVRWAMVISGQEDWAPVRDLLNLGAGLDLYSHVDFDRYLIVAYFRGPAESSGHRLELQSATVRGNEVQVRFRFLRVGRTTDIGYPYQLVAMDKKDLWDGAPALHPRDLSFTVWEGRSRVKTIRTTLQPPPPDGGRAVWPTLRVVGAGIPQGWSAAGDAVLLSREDASGASGAPGQGLYTAPAGGGREAVLIYSPGQGAAGSARFSPDGSRLAFILAEADRSRLCVLPTGSLSGDPVDLTPPGFDPGGGYSWSPDGTRLAVLRRLPDASGGRYGLVVISAAGPSGGEPIYSQQGRIVGPRWTVDGSIYFLRETSQGTVLSRVGASGSPPGDVVRARSYDVTPDGKWLAYLEETGPQSSALYVAETATLEAGASRGKLLACGEIASPVISPDGRLVAYSLVDLTGGDSHEADVWVVSADGTLRQRLTGGAYARPIAFGAGGASLLVELVPPASAPASPGTLTAVVHLP